MSKHGQRNDRRNTKKVLATIAAGGMTAAAVSAGTFAAFSGSDSVTQEVDTATMALALDGPGKTAMDAPITDAVPGDQWQRAVDLTFTGDVAATDGVLDFTAVGSDAKMSGAMTVSVDGCAIAWVAAADGSFTCATPTALVTDQPLGTAGMSLGSYTATAEHKYLRVTTKFASTADNTFKGLTNNIVYTFNIDQRAADTTR